MNRHQPNRGPSRALALIALFVLLAWGCGTDPASSASNNGGGDDTGVVSDMMVTDGGSDDMGGQDDGGGQDDLGPSDTGSEDTGGQDAAEPSIDICVLNEEPPDGACAQPPVIDFGTVATGQSEMRLFSLTNNTSGPIQVTSAYFDVTSSLFTIPVARYVDDPNDPGTLMRVDESLITSLDPGEALYFEVTLAPTTESGPLPVSEAIVDVEGGAAGSQSYSVTIEGELQGCSQGFADCDDDPMNGCEVNTNDDLNHCGGCDQACDYENAQETCDNGQCTFDGCDPNFADCDDDLDTNGCEVDTTSDPQHCSACNTPCTYPNATGVCMNSTCSLGMCSMGYGDCDPGAAGCETDTSSSLQHCGGCNQPCSLQNATESCSGGNCEIASCDAGWGNCDMMDSTGCEGNLQTNQYCGDCNTPCSLMNADATCTASYDCVISNCLGAHKDCNDLDGDGCEIDTDTNLNHCGGCNMPCDYANASESCNGGNCDFDGCDTDYWDVDDDLSNGCEYNCTFVSATDSPDDAFEDTNCDGIDGDVTQAVFVSPAGNDNNPGTMEQPLKTISKGISVAEAQGKDVYAAGGTYNPATTITLSDGVSVYGGYDGQTWARSDGNVAELAVNDAIGMSASSISSTTIIDRIRVNSASVSGARMSSYALMATNSDGLVLRHSTFTAGAGGDGTNGNSPGGSATNGNPGSQGQAGCEDSSFLCSSCSRPNGGARGTNSACSGANGGSGGTPGKGGNNGNSGGSSVAGVSGGFGTPDGQGNWNTPSTYWGRNGSNGSPGTNGSAGQPAFFSSGFLPSNGLDGTPGSYGEGGGGGGGGGGGTTNCNSYGGAGGGGGAGGCGGSGAGGGTSGGASIAVYLWNSNITIETCTLTTTGGGDGGNGGTGQQGGDGAVGGNCGGTGRGNCYGQSAEQDDGSNGGRGGYGGDGGRGGHGGGGTGGPSIGVVQGGGSNPTMNNNSFSLGPSGSGGFSSGNSGSGGTRTNTFTP